jgi:anti-anti-sigma factor
MTFAVQPGHAERRLRLHGELDIAEADGLVDAVADAVDPAGDLVFDLRGLEFLDSSGVRSFVRVAEWLVDGSLILEAPTPPVQRVLDLVQIDDGSVPIVIVPA